MSKKCVCGNEMFTVFMCRKCEHLLYVEEDENFPQKLGKIAAKSCPYVNRIGQLTVSVLLNRFARKEHRT